MRSSEKYSCIAAALALLCAVLATAEPLRIGYVTDLTGKGAFIGVQSQFGAMMARDELRANGVAVDVIFEDSKADTGAAVSSATKLITLDKVSALLSDTTPVTVAISPVAKAAKIPLLYQSPVLSVKETNPYSFRNFLDYELGCRRIAAHWKNLGVRNVAHIKINMEFGELCLRGSREVYPAQLVFDYNTGDDVKSIIATMKARNIEALFQTAYEVDMLNRLRAMRELRFSARVGTPEPLLTPLVIEQGREALDNAVTFGFPRLADSFLTKVRSLDPDHEMNNIHSAAIAYTQVHQIAAAAARCAEKKNAPRGCLVWEIEQAGADSALGFEGWQGRVAYYPIRLKEWRGGGGWSDLK